MLAEKYSQQALDAELLAHLAEERDDIIGSRAHLEEYKSFIELSQYHQRAAMPTIHSVSPSQN